MYRPPSLVKTATAVLLSTLVVGACVTKAHGATVVLHSHNRVSALGTSVPAPEFPPSTVGSGFDGLASRVKQATADAADAGAEISIVILDRSTGEIVSNGNETAFPVASVAKLYIADDLLLQVAKGQTQLSPAERTSFDTMLRSSDDGAAENFWNRSGGSDIISRVSGRYGLTGTSTPYDGHWYNTLSTASDLVRYYDKLLAGSGGLPAEQADVIIDDLSESTPTGVDGYPQRFGIPDGLFAEPVAVKQGWMCCWNGDNWMHMSTGIVGPDHRYVLVVASLQPSDDGTARNTLTQAVKTMFPSGRI